jgi:hypothetical protein
MNESDLKLRLYPWELSAHYELFLSEKSFISFHDGIKILEKRLLSQFEIRLILKKVDQIKIPIRIREDSFSDETCPDIQSTLNIKSHWYNGTIKWTTSEEKKKPFSSIISFQNLLFELLPLDELEFDFPIYK